ncbi:MAG: hypothetical protein ACTSSI_14995 [Candidatus Helarchaeota archaeon]
MIKPRDPYIFKAALLRKPAKRPSGGTSSVIFNTARVIFESKEDRNEFVLNF